MPNYHFTHEWQRGHERTPPERKHNRRPMTLRDFEREQVVDGYDPVVDGFGYPADPKRPARRAGCYCNLTLSLICQPCFDLLLKV